MYSYRWWWIGGAYPDTSNWNGGGAGGAGAVHDRNNVTLDLSGPWSFNVTIGAGGSAKGTQQAKGNDGSSSAAAFPTGTLTAPGGGGGGVSDPSFPAQVGRAGGSGGGGASYNPPSDNTGGSGDGDPFPGTPGNSPPNGWGHDGGDGSHGGPHYGSGGGGGGGGNAGAAAHPKVLVKKLWWYWILCSCYVQKSCIYTTTWTFWYCPLVIILLAVAVVSIQDLVIEELVEVKD